MDWVIRHALACMRHGQCMKMQHAPCCCCCLCLRRKGSRSSIGCIRFDVLRRLWCCGRECCVLDGEGESAGYEPLPLVFLSLLLRLCCRSALICFMPDLVVCEQRQGCPEGNRARALVSQPDMEMSVPSSLPRNFAPRAGVRYDDAFQGDMA